MVWQTRSDYSLKVKVQKSISKKGTEKRMCFFYVQYVNAKKQPEGHKLLQILW